jgi:diadenosine tetraphosphate (Ap4A) HIT family hydrolase
VPLTPEELHARASAVADADGRLPLSRMSGWEVFPFEPDGLRVVRLRPPELPEPPRAGVDGVGCWGCEASSGVVWSDEHWRLATLGEPTGAPLLLVLEPVEHVDLPMLSDERAGELGRLLVHVARAMEALPLIARAHVARWGDGSEHLHVFFYARPAGFPQLRGTCFAIWDDLLPPVPVDVRDADAVTVAETLVAAVGGRVGRRSLGGG